MAKPCFKSIKFIIATSLITLSLPLQSFGAGYQMRYQSAETMGTGFASDVSGAKTASGFFNNPAIIAFMEEGKHFSAELTTLIPSGSFEGQTTYANNSASGSSDGFSNVSLLPSIYYGQKLAEKMYLTTTLTIPWATNTDYDEDWIGRYQATKTSLTTVNVTPSFVYSVSDKLAISAGVQIQYAVGELGSRVDTTLVGGAGGVDDLHVVFDGDNVAFGAALSALYKYSDALRLGFQYRSKITHNLKGDQSVDPTTPTSAGIAANPGVQNAGLGDGQSVEAEITIPDNITLGASYLLNSSLDLHASLSWTGWSSLDKLTVVNKDRTAGIDSTTELQWDDTYFLAVGADYYFTEKLTLRSGLSYETGAPPDEFRTPRGVDDDRLGLNLGASFQFSDLLTFHGALTQLVFLDKPSIANVDPRVGSPLAGTVTGEYSTSATLVRLGVSARF